MPAATPQSPRRFATRAPSQHYDVVIAGGGAVGSVLARLLLDDGFGARDDSSYRRPLKVALLEQRSAPPSLADLLGGSKAPNPRAYALSPASLSYLGPSMLQSLVKHNRCGVYDAMQIWEHDGPAQLHFVGEDLRGAIEEGRLVDLQRSLGVSAGEGCIKKQQEALVGGSGRRRPARGIVCGMKLKGDDRIDLLDNLQIQSIRAPSPSDMGHVEPPPARGTVLHSQQRRGRTDIHQSARGRRRCQLSREAHGGELPHDDSLVRDGKAVTCTVELEGGMVRTAFQRFLPHGPIALLPVWNGATKDGKTETIYANVVWSTTPTEADHLLSLSPVEFTATLNQHLCQGPSVNPSLLPDSEGAPSIPSAFDHRKRNGLPPPHGQYRNDDGNLDGIAFTQLLSHAPQIGRSVRCWDSISSLSHVVTSGAGSKGRQGGYTSPRVALVGDAAHTMHPMAGQGLNLGMADVNSLAKLIKEATDSGMDVGGTDLFLDRYNDERLLQGWGTVGGVHGLHEIFGCSGTPPGSVVDGTYDGGRGSAGGLQSLIGYGRSMGMNVVNGLPLVRRTLAEVAAGATPPGLSSPTQRSQRT
ncbi:LOW QUALITY PROTEIN: hypothetical protein ACHAXT_010067 [Thalassiosira profunda]